ncbi:MAG: hypothetical protein AB2A00_12170 [Myxococcota bacterium]
MEVPWGALLVHAAIVVGILLGIILGDVHERHRGFDPRHHDEAFLQKEQRERMAGWHPGRPTPA